MEESWADFRRKKARQRRIWIALGAVAIVVAAFVVGSLRNGESSERVQSAPAYDGKDRTLDTSPFKPAEADKRGATTLPNGVFDPTSAVPTLSTTTTRPVPLVTLPPKANAPAGDLVCSAVADLYDFVRASNELTDSSTLPQGAAQAFRSAANKLTMTGDHAYDAGIAILNRAADELEQVTDPAGVAPIVEPVLNQSTPEIREASKALTQHVASSCSDLAEQHPGPG